MSRSIQPLALSFCAVLAAMGVRADPAPVPRPPAATKAEGVEVATLETGARANPDRVCTADGIYCIAQSRYLDDVCAVIETTATKSALDPNFLARLIWKESLFQAGALSPMGALGIAQFMPGTAKLRGLEDPYNPAEALRASAHYLAELTRTYGNIGLAAVAYNGGEARAEKFIAGQGGLPLETRAYVAAITGYTAEVWRDAPPDKVDLLLSRDKPFQSACVEMASRRVNTDFTPSAPVLPWGVIIASNRDRAGVERQVGHLRNRYAEVIGAETFTYTRGRRPGSRLRLYMAQIGRESRGDAEDLCQRLRRSGADCMVLRN